GRYFVNAHTSRNGTDMPSGNFDGFPVSSNSPDGHNGPSGITTRSVDSKSEPGGAYNQHVVDGSSLRTCSSDPCCDTKQSGTVCSVVGNGIPLRSTPPPRFTVTATRHSGGNWEVTLTGATASDRTAHRPAPSAR